GRNQLTGLRPVGDGAEVEGAARAAGVRHHHPADILQAGVVHADLVDHTVGEVLGYGIDKAIGIVRRAIAVVVDRHRLVDLDLARRAADTGRVAAVRARLRAGAVLRERARGRGDRRRVRAADRRAH